MHIEVRNVGKSADRHPILRDVCLDVRGGGIFIVLGPNGAGKTTLLRIMALLDKPGSGDIFYDGRPASAFSTATRTEVRRRLGFVFQNPLLLNGSVADNIRYALKIRKRPGWEERIHPALNAVGLAAKKDLDVQVLSGGEKQRLQLARAMVLEPDVLFADEPTSNLDPLSSRFIEDELQRMAQAGKTVILTTHNLVQARLLGNQVFFMIDGAIVQQGTAFQVLENPSTLEAAYFSPLTNVFRGRLIRTPQESALEIGRTRISVVTSLEDGPVAAILRPEDILVSRGPIQSSARNHFSGTVTAVTDLGMIVLLQVACPDFPVNVTITRQSLGEMGIHKGETVHLTFKASAVLLFPGE